MEFVNIDPNTLRTVVYSLVNTRDYTIREAILQFCEDIQVEPESIAKCIPEDLLEDLRLECEKYHLIPPIGRLKLE